MLLHLCDRQNRAGWRAAELCRCNVQLPLPFALRPESVHLREKSVSCQRVHLCEHAAAVSVCVCVLMRLLCNGLFVCVCASME